MIGRSAANPTENQNNASSLVDKQSSAAGKNNNNSILSTHRQKAASVAEETLSKPQIADLSVRQQNVSNNQSPTRGNKKLSNRNNHNQN